jgi:hypothetical protein
MVILDAGPGDGSFPWWVFLIMPFMMIGMGLMMWFMMRMMMGMGGDGASHGPGDASQKPVAHPEGEAEVESLRQEVEQLRSRLTAVEGEPAPQQPDDKPPASPGGASRR